ncbi:MAG TPA: SelT/SelW/SelH family protein [Cyclobacteriaceae bacterium]|nr:SelT/SelW/SelH family protein [Cyclobacteriaceae bacterium]
MQKPKVTITYCTRCKWMLRAAWMAQEILSTFDQEIGEASLKPDHTGGVFEIHVNDELVFSRVTNSGFPDIKELKRLIRDKVAPGKNLGHIDR